DIYQRHRTVATDRSLVWVGRLAAGVALVVAISLVPLLDSYESLFIGVNDIIAHIAPPVTAVFLMGVFWRKASALSAQYTLWLGALTGAVVFALHKLVPEFPTAGIPFMMMSFFLLCWCMGLQIIFSWLFPVQHTAVSAT